MAFGSSKPKRNHDHEPDTRPIPLSCATCSGRKGTSTRCTACLGKSDPCSNCGSTRYVWVSCPTCRGTGKA